MASCSSSGGKSAASQSVLLRITVNWSKKRADKFERETKGKKSETTSRGKGQGSLMVIKGGERLLKVTGTNLNHFVEFKREKGKGNSKEKRAAHTDSQEKQPVRRRNVFHYARTERVREEVRTACIGKDSGIWHR